MQVCACTRFQSSSKLVFSLAAGLITLPALAGSPAALDHVPTDAQAVIVVPNIGALLSDVNAINAMLGDQGQSEIVMLTAMLRGWPGLDVDGSMAIVLEFDEEMSDDPDGTILLPVSNFAEFSQGKEPVDGLYELEIDDEVLFFRDAGGGFVVLGEDAEIVSEFDASDGNLKANSAILGKSGSRIASSNDIFMYINFDGFEELIEEGLEEMESQSEMVEMMGGAEAVAGFDMMLGVVQTIANDGLSMAAGANFDPEGGLSFDFGFQFKEGSQSASYFLNDGDAGKYFANAPEMDYFFASAFDFSGDGISKLLSQYFDMAEQFDTTGMMNAGVLKMMMGDIEGGIQIMGAPDNIMGGLFTNMLYYMETGDADAYIETAQKMYSSMDEQLGQLEELGVKIEVSMDTEPTEINGTDAYGFSIGIDLSGLGDLGGAMGMMDPGMIMGMIFGADGGPSGYLAKGGDGVVTTMSKNAEFLSKAVDGANGKNTMAGNASIAKTAAMLPDNRIMETYIGVDHLMNTAGPMLMMFGVLPEFEPIDALAPIGIGMTADGGGVLVRTVIPMATIGSIMEMVPQDAFGDDDWDEGWDDDDDQDQDDDDDMEF